MAEHKITVNAYAPGIVGTAMWDLIDEKLGEKTGAKKGDTIKKYTDELIALDRLMRWRSELDALEELRAAIKTLSMHQSEKVKLFALTTQVKNIVVSVQKEIREKLKT
ncbi:hypothetical protein SNOG_13271 [Parastagonospora nodorum SN15]|uniref:Uncharacterized protein n=1 Tax=Phaeosphaeria nodorum (strain SN15 / ATCC MYA-4574 / FGSC 10173) TaxID=321614 RepID=Q0U4P3_PHANO|nr:hypothetical protein SNOG_13271 [Parastagonospora nodorum SN15]EAT79155.2 hypothetical protein SNOG_13271 [Parastagonospora nodorum SN15]